MRCRLPRGAAVAAVGDRFGQLVEDLVEGCGGLDAGE